MALTTDPAVGAPNDTPLADEKSAPFVESDNERSSNDDKHVDEKPNEEPDIVYPTSVKLLLITLALCLSVFCMALVRRPVAASLSARNAIRIGSLPFLVRMGNE